MKKTLSLIQLQHASLFLGAVCAMSHSWAQASDPAPKTYPLVEVVEKPLEYRQFEKVEITGSAILAKAAKQALPLQIIDRREIERSGAQSLAELIQRLPFISNYTDFDALADEPDVNVRYATTPGEGCTPAGEFPAHLLRRDSCVKMARDRTARQKSEGPGHHVPGPRDPAA